MRLLSLTADSERLELTNFPHNVTPEYAILSHTWGTDDEEVTFADITNGLAPGKLGYAKLRFCADKATAHGLKYFWVDTCCIDKSSSAELQESINSMFNWYRGAKICFVFLSDVSVGTGDKDSDLGKSLWEADFRASRWFTRGWTLQELLAPAIVEFYSSEGRFLGDKGSLETQVHEITGIPLIALRGCSLSDFSVDERFSWAQGRQTTRDEDWAYSLLGLFGLVIPLLYGEGRDRAVVRLKREIAQGFQDPSTSSQQSVTGAEDYEDRIYPETVSESGGINQRATATSNAQGSYNREIRTHDNLRSWIQTLQNRGPQSQRETSGEESQAGLARIKQLVQNKRALSVSSIPSNSLLSTAAPIFSNPVSIQQQKQPVPSNLQRLIVNNVLADQVHLVIQGLGSSGNEIREKMFPRNGTIEMVLEHLASEGFTRLSGFRVVTNKNSYLLGCTSLTNTLSAVEITDAPSRTRIEDGYCLNFNERFIDFYNSRFATISQVGILANLDSIQVHDKQNQANKIQVEFKRILRVPDDGKTYQIPPPQSSFPLFLSRQFAATLPAVMVEKDGMFFPMLQREALTIAFSSVRDVKSQFAIRVYTGGVNAVTGQPVLENEPSTIARHQDYIVAPQQELLSGYKYGDTVKQFVAMPMGDRYSVEYQLTGEEFVGGIQFEIIPRLRDTVVFRRHPVPSTSSTELDQNGIDLFNCPKKLGLQPGQRIYMVDHDPGNLYDLPPTTRHLDEHFIEPSTDIYGKAYRPTFIHELFDGPTFERLDLSSSLVVSAVQAIKMIAEVLPGETIEFHCSHLAQISDVRNFLLKHLQQKRNSSLRMPFDPSLELTIAGKTYGEKDNALIDDLNLTSPQQVIVTVISSSRLVQGLPQQPSDLETPQGWSMGISMGGKLKQDILVDESPYIWNWAASRILTVQILNTVAFQAVTGLFPPLSPLTLSLAPTSNLSVIPEPPIVDTSTTSLERIRDAKSISELDWERGTAPGVVINGDTVVVCVCCETNICDSLLIECGHMFCDVCISYYMTENAVTKCGFCLQVSNQVIRFAAQALAVESIKHVDKVSAHPETSIIETKTDAIETKYSRNETEAFESLFEGGSPDWNQFDSMIRTSQDGIRRKTIVLLSLLLAQTMSRKELNPDILIGRLIRFALCKDSEEMWRMMVPLYERTHHVGFKFAKEHDIYIVDSIANSAKYFYRHGYYNIDAVVENAGLRAAQLLVKLDIIETSSRVERFQTVIQNSWTGELALLLSLGMDVSRVIHDGATALHMTDAADAAKLLCEYGASLAALDGDGNTPVLTAVIYRKKEVLEVLLRQKACKDILDHRNRFGKAGVHYVQTKPELLAMLIEAGADPSLEVGPGDGSPDWTKAIR